MFSGFNLLSFLSVLHITGAWYKQLKEINRKPKSVIYADNFLHEKEGKKDSAKLPSSSSSSILLAFHRTILWLPLNNSNSQVTFAIADSSDVYIALYLCIADRETDQMEQELAPFSPISEWSVYPIKNHDTKLECQKSHWIYKIRSIFSDAVLMQMIHDSKRQETVWVSLPRTFFPFP